MSPSFAELTGMISDRSVALRAAARGAGREAQVPGCPDWSLADLIAHLGEVQRFWAAAVRAGPSAGPPGDDQVTARLPEGDLLEWSAAATEALVAALLAAGPDRGCWTWWAGTPAPMTAGAVARHQVQEAAVHAFDAQEAGGRADQLPAAIAADGVSEFLTVMVPASGPWPHEPARLTLDAGRGGAWLVDLGPERAAARPADAAPADGREPAAAVRGSGSDLVLALYGRRPPWTLEVAGDRQLVERFFAWPARD